MMTLGTGAVCGQNFPVKPIRILTGSAGGSNDSAARLIAGGISGPLGQPVIVENRASVALAAPAVAQSPPDGYTLVSAGDLIWLGPLLRGQPDAIREYSPITILASAPNVLVVHPSLPVKSVKELIVLAKARPGDLNYSTSSAGGIDHIAGELFKSVAGVKVVWVPFKGGAPSTIAVVAGEVQLAFLGVFLVSPHVRSGRLRALAVTSAQPSALVAGLPTMAASGVPGYELVGIDAMYAPAKTPVAVVTRLNQEIVRFLRTPEAKEKYLLLGGEVVGSSPEEHLEKLKSRIATIGKLIKEAGIKVD
jgi:tripartite-type tricarboxylate transporter receptor subunit TctC